MDKITKDSIAKEMLEFAVEFKQQRLNHLKKISRNELSQQFDYEIDKQATSDTIQLLFQFPDYGRLIDMRPKTIAHDHYSKEQITEIEKWVKQRGVQRLANAFFRNKKIPYAKFGVNTNNKKLINKMAWGIAKKRAKGFFKKRAWWNKKKTIGVTTLFNNVLANLATLPNEAISKAING